MTRRVTDRSYAVETFACCLIVLAVVCGMLEAFAQGTVSRALGFVTPPSEDFRRAGDLFSQSRHDEATFLFYRAQLRARVHLEARPELKATGDQAFLQNLATTVGRPINERAFDDVPTMVQALERVLAWHETNDDPFTPKERYPAAHTKARLWLAETLIEIQLSKDRARLERVKKALLHQY